MNVLLNFAPYETVLLDASTTSSSVKFKLPASFTARDCVVTNDGPSTVFVGFGNGSATANTPAQGALNATPVLPGTSVLMLKNTMPQGADTCAAKTVIGSARVYFTSGTGN